MKKQVLSFLLAFVMIVGLLPAGMITASAADPEVSKIIATGTGYKYDSTEGAYVPTFSTLAAYDTTGTKVNLSNFVTTSAFYKSGSFSSANELTTAPVVGATYYFAIYVDMYINENLSYGYESVSAIKNNSKVTIHGFEVEFYSFMEREMGSYFEVKYSATCVSPDLYVGGVGMYDGEYLAVGATATTTKIPATTGYAYYNDGKLVLYNYRYSGHGYVYDTVDNEGAVIYSTKTIEIGITGTNTLTSEKTLDEAIRSEGNIVLSGNGTLNINGKYYGINSMGNITITGGNYNIYAERYAVFAHKNLIVTSGNIDAKATSDYYESNAHALRYYESFSVSGTLDIRASTEPNGTLGEYDIAKHEDYDWIKITLPEIYVAGIGLHNDYYLGVGSTVPTKIMPSGGYAHYSGGVLTLKDYSYSGKGYTFNSENNYSATVYFENALKIVLEGTNSLKQTASGSINDDTSCIYTGGGLDIEGEGTLTVNGPIGVLVAKEDLVVNTGATIAGIGGYDVVTLDGDIKLCGGTFNCTMFSFNNIIVECGTIYVANIRTPIQAFNNITIKGGNVTAISTASATFDGTSQAIKAGSSTYPNGKVTIASDLKVLASTEPNGTFGEYAEANLKTYDHIMVVSSDIYVGGVGMIDGDYLQTGATETTRTQPTGDGGYAYYSGGVLTLNGYAFEGEGYVYDTDAMYTAGIYSESALKIVLTDKNFITDTGVASTVIYVGDTLTIDGTGSLMGVAKNYGILAYNNFVVNGGTITLTNDNYIGIYVKNDASINNADLTVNAGGKGIYADYGSITVDANLTITSGDNAIDSDTGLVIISGGTINVTTGNYGIHSYDTIALKNATVSITSQGNGIYVYRGSIEINDSTLNIESRTSTGIYVYDIEATVSMNNCEVTVVSEMSAGIDISGALIIKDSKLDVTTGKMGVYAAEGIIVENSTVEVDAVGNGITADKSITINSGKVTVVAGFYGIRSNNKDIVIFGGEVSAKSTDTENDASYTAIAGYEGVYIAPPLIAKASETPDGVLGECKVPVDHYDYVYITALTYTDITEINAGLVQEPETNMTVPTAIP